MANGSTQNYKHGRKNQWRRWAWKEIASRVKDRKSAKVLYLAGKDDLDRAVAVSYGFSPENMYAVDNSAEVVKHLREKGVVCIEGDFIEVAVAGRCYFDVLYADLCCGFTAEVDNFVKLLLSMKKNTVVMVNLQRGRDKYSLNVKERIEIYYCSEMSKDRSAMVIYSYFSHALMFISGGKYLDAGGLQREAYDIVSDRAYPLKRSYKGKRVYMDSVIFNVNVSDVLDVHINDENLLKQSKQKLAAAKAVSSMRKSGRIDRCPRW